MKVYKSRVDWWIALALAFGPIAAVAVLVSGVTSGEAQLLYTGIGVSALVVLIYGGLVFPMSYAVDAEGLTIRSGLMRIHLPWQRMGKAELSGNPLSSPALSLRRICIDYRKANGKETFVMISPPDREAFLADLAERSPRHQLRDGALVETEAEG